MNTNVNLLAPIGVTQNSRKPLVTPLRPGESYNHGRHFRFTGRCQSVRPAHQRRRVGDASRHWPRE